MPTWFSNCVGFKEGEYYATQEALAKQLRRSGESLQLAGRQVGEWHFKSVSEQRASAMAKLKALWRAKDGPQPEVGTVKMRHTVGDVRLLHAEYPGCMFQAASQFNCLEFVSPSQVPEHGITRYKYDRTQGPACAMACPAGTAYRNYLLECNGELGQTSTNQLDGLEDLGGLLHNDTHRFWQMNNGYLDSTDERLRGLSRVLSKALTTGAYEMYKDAIRIGVHYNTEVEGGHSPPLLVGQAYCAAPAINYSAASSPASWSGFSRLILEASYEATLWAAVNNHDFEQHPVPTVFLTKVGGGVFGNKAEWIIAAIEAAAKAFQRHTKNKVAINLILVHYGALEAPYPERLSDASVAYTAPAKRSRADSGAGGAQAKRPRAAGSRSPPKKSPPKSQGSPKKTSPVRKSSPPKKGSPRR
eukprot:TRINITY_DN14980_c0_g1_i1.p1 TRINITY_DN14980_c0_g1~~TRINITY_DN14980_c0_g1_i1.p1  ORF type:complete len:415 (+),score=135.53 TRINITY_DN14980_c0_g1_i1:68-1312(+)